MIDTEQTNIPPVMMQTSETFKTSTQNQSVKESVKVSFFDKFMGLFYTKTSEFDFKRQDFNGNNDFVFYDNDDENKPSYLLDEVDVERLDDFNDRYFAADEDYSSEESNPLSDTEQYLSKKSEINDWSALEK